MKHNRSPRLIASAAVFVAVCGSALASATPISAQTESGGVGVAPAFIEIQDGLRSGTYSERLILENADTVDVEFELLTEGEVGSWVTFTSTEDRTHQLTSVQIPAGRREDVRVQFDVPPDVANGSYNGAIEVRSRRVGDDVADGAGAGVGIGALVDLSMQVVGTERRAGALVDARVDPTEVGMPGRFHAIVRNDGNVQLRPVLGVAILRADQLVDELDTRAELFPVDPEQQGDVYVDWDTSLQLGGDYVARFVVTDVAGGAEQSIGHVDVPFRLQPRGTFTRDGVLESLELVNRPEPGGVAKLSARFQNTGQIETTAVFEGDLYVDDHLVSTVESAPRATPAGESVDVDFALNGVEEAGYRVVGRINFEGHETEERAVEFRVGTGGTGGAVFVAIADRGRRSADLPERRRVAHPETEAGASWGELKRKRLGGLINPPSLFRQSY